MTQRNIELLEKTLQHIKDHPEQHEQAEWLTEDDAPCGTVGCFFGWAVALSEVELNSLDNWTVKTPGEYQDMELPDAAAALLGLNEREAAIISRGGNTLPMLELMVKDLINGDQLQQPEAYGEGDEDRLVIFDEVANLL